MADVEEYETAMIVDTERRNEADDTEYWKKLIEERRYESDILKD